MDSTIWSPTIKWTDVFMQ